MEEAEGYQQLMTQYNLTQEETAQRVGKSRSAVANALRLLNLCPPVRAMVEDGRLSNGHARTILPLSPAHYRHLRHIVTNRLIVYVFCVTQVTQMCKGG